MIVVCGPESSGTRILHRIVTDYIGVPALHQSMPNAGVWWDGRDFPDARFVIMVRRPDVTTLSAIGRALAPDAETHRADWARAIALLAAIPNACWVIYEAMLAEPQQQADNIAHWLGVTPSGEMPEIVDGNARWLSVLQ